MIYVGNRQSLTFCHLWEDLGHWVDPLLRIHVGDGEDVGSVACEVAVEEHVHEVHLAHDVDEIKELAEDELVDVHVVSPHVPGDVVGDDVSLVPGGLCICLEGHVVEVLQQELEEAALPVLPEEVGEIARKRLSDNCYNCQCVD